jgi:uncharacterized membrane protein
MKKIIILTVVIFILSHLVSIYIMGGFYNQTIETKLFTSVIALFISGIICTTTYGDNL